MRAFDPGSHVLVLNDIPPELRVNQRLKEAVIHQDEGLLLLECRSRAHVAAVVGALPGCTLSERFMDRFYFVYVFDTDAHQDTLTHFFDAIAPQYESFIDCDRNRLNIAHLLDVLGQALGTLEGMTVVDFGCGSGLSAALPRPSTCKLLGFDVCPQMRALARLRGLPVWGPHEIAVQPKGTIDGAFASYVFHLLPSMGSLNLLWSRMRIGGVLVGNLHKHCGGERLAAVMSDLGARAITPWTAQSRYIGEEVVAYERTA